MLSSRSSRRSFSESRRAYIARRAIDAARRARLMSHTPVAPPETFALTRCRHLPLPSEALIRNGRRYPSERLMPRSRRHFTPRRSIAPPIGVSFIAFRRFPPCPRAPIRHARVPCVTPAADDYRAMPPTPRRYRRTYVHDSSFVMRFHEHHGVIGVAYRVVIVRNVTPRSTYRDPRCHALIHPMLLLMSPIARLIFLPLPATADSLLPLLMPRQILARLSCCCLSPRCREEALSRRGAGAF